MIATSTDPPGSKPSRRRVAAEIGVVWVLLAGFWTASRWSDLRGLRFGDPDDAARLVQVRELLGGQSWWDLTLTRIGTAGAEMHWSRHMDALVGGVVGLLKPLLGAETAELLAIIGVPLALLLVGLAAISSIARLVLPRPDVGLFAMVAFGFAAGAVTRLGPGRIDHHGLQLVMVLLLVRLVLAWPHPAAALAAGVVGGTSLAIGLESLPPVAAVVAGVALRWAIGGGAAVGSYRRLGFALVIAAVLSSLLFAPTGRLFGTDCDVFSLGFLGLVAIPTLVLAAVGGREWSVGRRWFALSAAALGGIGWFSVASPVCVEGPYQALPDLAIEKWIDLVAEAQSMPAYVATSGWGLGLAVGALVAIALVAISIIRRGRLDLLPWGLALAAALAVATWQVRMIPQAQALAAPALGVLISRMRDRIRVVPARLVATLLALVVLSGWVFGVADSAATPDVATALGPCVTEQLLDELDGLPVGMVAVEMNHGPDVLVHTEHRVLGPPYHRAHADIVAMYQMFVADPVPAVALAGELGVDYVMVCEATGLSNLWSADNPEGLLAVLLEDNPPDGMTKLIDTARSRVYVVTE